MCGIKPLVVRYRGVRKKIAVKPEVVGIIDMNALVADNLKAVAGAKNKDMEDVVATILNRERQEPIIAELREIGARIKLINDGDIAGAISTAFDKTGVDILLGSGGAPKGITLAVSLKALDGESQECLLRQSDAELKRYRKNRS